LRHKDRPILSAARAASVFKEMVGLRRYCCNDSQYFGMSEIWDDLAEDSDEINIKFSKSAHLDFDNSKAGVVAFDKFATLIVPETMWAKAVEGDRFANFTLAHEFAHLALEHHLMSANVKNFQLTNRGNDLANIPPNSEELEANYAAVFFQCGDALMEPNIDALNLAKRACTDVYYVKKAISLCKLEAFRRELEILYARYERVIL